MTNRVQIRTEDGAIIWLHNVSNDAIATWVLAFFKYGEVLTIVIADHVFLDRDEVSI